MKQNDNQRHTWKGGSLRPRAYNAASSGQGTNERHKPPCLGETEKRLSAKRIIVVRSQPGCLAVGSNQEWGKDATFCQ